MGEFVSLHQEAGHHLKVLGLVTHKSYSGVRILRHTCKYATTMQGHTAAPSLSSVVGGCVWGVLTLALHVSLPLLPPVTMSIIVNLLTYTSKHTYIHTTPTTGLTFGCIHVLSGADHLSALATLAVGSRFKAFSLGIRWGLGHSTGLVVVACVLLSLKDQVDPTALERSCNWVVGVFMVALGAWGICKAFKNEKNRKTEKIEAAARAAAMDNATSKLEEGRAANTVSSLTDSEEEEGDRDAEVEMTTMPGGYDRSSSTSTSSKGKRPHKDKEEAGSHVLQRINTQSTEPLECEEADHWILRHMRCLPHLDIESPVVQKVVSFCVGIVHGIAGPGGVLGVLPAVKLAQWQPAALYLGTFCLTSTFVMGIFAAIYGEVTSRVGAAHKIEFRLELFSAGMSIGVGLIWLALIIAGKLDEVFN